MSSAAKTTPSVQLRLKETQDAIGALRLAHAKQNTGPSQESVETLEDTPEEVANEPPKTPDPITEPKHLGSALIKHITEAQAMDQHWLKTADNTLSDRSLDKSLREFKIFHAQRKVIIEPP